MSSKPTDADVPMDLNGIKIRFDGTQIWQEVLKDFRQWAKDKGSGKAFSLDPTDVPREPSPGLRARYMAGTSHHGERKVMEYWKRADEVWVNLISRVITAFLKILTQDMRTFLVSKNIDLEISTRPNFLAMVQLITNRYGVWSDERGQLNYNTMKAIPCFTDLVSTQSGLLEMDRLRRERISWNNPMQVWNDANMRSYLLEKMEVWDELKFAYNQCLSQPLWTYDQCLANLNTVTDRLENKSLLAKMVKKNPLLSHQVAIDSPSRSSSSLDQLYSQSAGYDEGIQTFGVQWGPSGYAAPSDTRACNNCGMVGHLMRMCPAPYCRGCNKSWSSVESPGYHHNSSCPTSGVWIPSQMTSQLRFPGHQQQPRPPMQVSNRWQSPRPPGPIRGVMPYPTQVPRPYPPRMPRPQMGQGGGAPKRQRNAMGYQVNHVGYDLDGFPVYQESVTEYQEEEGPVHPAEDGSSGYPI